MYHRLNVVSIATPADRREDIVPLSIHFLTQMAARYGNDISGFASEALEQVVSAPWPGNVRQLQNAVEQAVALATGGVIPASLLQNAINNQSSALTSLDEAKHSFERDYLVRILKITRGNVACAGKLAQRNRTEFYKLLDRYQIDPKLFKAEESRAAGRRGLSFCAGNDCFVSAL